jgi:hypothetical protein
MDRGAERVRARVASCDQSHFPLEYRMKTIKEVWFKMRLKNRCRSGSMNVWAVDNCTMRCRRIQTVELF